MESNSLIEDNNNQKVTTNTKPRFPHLKKSIGNEYEDMREARKMRLDLRAATFLDQGGNEIYYARKFYAAPDRHSNQRIHRKNPKFWPSMNYKIPPKKL